MSLFRILHVDDDSDIRMIVAMSLERDPGVSVQSYGSGAEGLAAAAADRPDVILLDVMMPVMDGPTTLAELRKDPRTAGIPVVFMTARVQKRDLDHLTSLGAIDVIAKPFDPTTLAASMRSLCGRQCTSFIAEGPANGTPVSAEPQSV